MDDFLESYESIEQEQEAERKKVIQMRERIREKNPAKEKDSMFPEIEPWPDPVEGGKLFVELTSLLERFVMMPVSSIYTCALWILHSWL